MALPEFDRPALLDKYALFHAEKSYGIEERKSLLAYFHSGECKCCENERTSIASSCPYFYEKIKNLESAWVHNDEDAWDDVINLQEECLSRNPPLDVEESDLIINVLCQRAEMTLVTLSNSGDGISSRSEIAASFGVNIVELN